MIVGGGLSVLITIRYFVKKERLSTEKQEIETEEFKIEFFKNRIADLEKEVDRLKQEQQEFKNVILDMCKDCKYKIYFEIAKERLNKSINNEK
jgi:predicted RNase H-like nuclease (RuvC/YqgF family)